MSTKEKDQKIYDALQSGDFSSITFGIIGAGDLGSAAARLGVNAGFKVLVSNSRGPESLTDLIEELGTNSKAVSTIEAARNSDILFLSVPYTKIAQLPVDDFKGRLIIDATNYASQRDGHVPVIDNGEQSASEHLQIHMPEVRFVKGFNNINAGQFVKLSRPKGHPERSVLPVASDDYAAYNIVASFIEQLGFDTLFTGPLSESWRYEPGLPAFVMPYIANPQALFDFLKTIAENPNERPAVDPGAVVSTEKIRNLIAQAEKKNRTL